MNSDEVTVIDLDYEETGFSGDFHCPADGWILCAP
jgi:hypothetical protein